MESIKRKKNMENEMETEVYIGVCYLPPESKE